MDSMRRGYQALADKDAVLPLSSRPQALSGIVSRTDGQYFAATFSQIPNRVTVASSSHPREVRVVVAGAMG